MDDYRHIVQYYETDMMGIVHHSNYVRWMEEAKLDFIEQLGWTVKRLKENGLVASISRIELKYLRPTTFGDEIVISSWIKDLEKYRLTLGHKMRKQNGPVVCTGETEHCLISTKGMLLAVDEACPELYEDLVKFVSLTGKEKDTHVHVKKRS